MKGSYERVARYLLHVHSSPWRWAIALLAFVIALALRFALHGILPAGHPFLTFFPAVIVATFAGGFLPGIALAIAAFATSWYYFIPPFGSFSIEGTFVVVMVFFAITMAIDLAVIHFMFVWLEELDAEREKNRRLSASHELMFKDVQQRIFDSLAAVSSLLAMQRGKVREEGAMRAFDATSKRLALVGRIHQQIHDPDRRDLAFGRFARELCRDLIGASGAEDWISFNVAADDLHINIEQSVPVGLIVAELVANAVEHAFVGLDLGMIIVTAERAGESVVIRVEDDGIGLPPEPELETARGMGLDVARRFSAQLGSKLSLKPGAKGGTIAELPLPGLQAARQPKAGTLA